MSNNGEFRPTLSVEQLRDDKKFLAITTDWFNKMIEALKDVELSASDKKELLFQLNEWVSLVQSIKRAKVTKILTGKEVK